MAVFLDTSFIVAFLNKKDSRNEKATALWNKIMNKKNFFYSAYYLLFLTLFSVLRLKNLLFMMKAFLLVQMSISGLVSI